ncbi:hypothetical protein [Streptomyces sp. NPDC055632]
MTPTSTLAPPHTLPVHVPVFDTLRDEPGRRPAGADPKGRSDGRRAPRRATLGSDRPDERRGP